MREWPKDCLPALLDGLNRYQPGMRRNYPDGGIGVDTGKPGRVGIGRVFLTSMGTRFLTHTLPVFLVKLPL